MSATDKAKDKVQSAKGHVKEATGKAVGDRSDSKPRARATRLPAT